EHGGKLGHHLALETPLRSESLRAREIHRQHHGEFTLLDVALDERPSHPRGDVPVDRPYLVAGLVFAHLGELHPLPLEHRPVLAGEQRVDQAASPELDEAHLTKHLRRHRTRYRLRASGGVRIERDRLLHACHRVTPAATEGLAEHGREGQGLSMVASMRCTTSSLVTSSASASYVVRTR